MKSKIEDDTMRIFIALRLDDETKKHIQEQVTKMGIQLSVDPDWLHITLVFLGEIDENKLKQVQKITEQINFRTIEIVIDHVGRFQSRSGDIWWLGIQKNTQIMHIQRRLVQRLKTKGFSLDYRFHPHITLARRVKPHVWKENSLIPIKTTIKKLSIILSEPVNGRYVYKEILG